MTTPAPALQTAPLDLAGEPATPAIDPLARLIALIAVIGGCGAFWIFVAAGCSILQRRP